jgi:hypothetical protein
LAGHVVGGFSVGEHLIIGDDDKGGDAEVLDLHPVLQGAEEMPDMQTARRAGRQ